MSWTKEKKAEYAKEYRRVNRQKIAAQRKARREADPERARENNRKWRKNNQRSVKNSYLKKKYGVTLEWYEEVLELQGGVCAICEGPPNSKNGYYSVDHCHKSGWTRGLLCSNCNSGIGNLRDDPDLVVKAGNYLLKHRDLEYYYEA
jgi:Autographiviridae endonuclease VII